MNDRTAIVGATGPTGRHLCRELSRRGARVRVISRSEANLVAAFGEAGVERRTADAVNAKQLTQALDGCGLVFDCVGLAADRMADHPRVARALAAALAETGGRCVQVSSYWSFMPVVRDPLDEDHPREDGPEWARLRREAEDVLRASGAAVAHLPDFYGEHVHTSTLQSPLRDAVLGKPMSWIGGADVAREYAYVPDAIAAVAELSTREEAYGASWIVPGAGPITPREVVAIASRHLGREVKLRTAGPWLLRVAGLFNRGLRAFLPMAPEYARPIRFDGSKLGGAIGSVRVTSYEEAIPRTLDWLASSAAG